ncbi:MAG: leucine-rich repeat protein, partial [Verrucomicrobiales bacterium]|nr:leucine-rich repeat protein [Verrucomicrobiales bacterium]
MNAMRGFGRWMRGAGVFQVRYQPRVSTTWAGHVAVVLSLLAGAALRVEAQYPWRTELRPDGTLIVFKTSPEWGVGCPTGDLVIPSTVNGRRVTSIGTYAFQGCSGLTRVTIPDSVTGIEYGAFERCTDLADITF